MLDRDPKNRGSLIEAINIIKSINNPINLTIPININIPINPLNPSIYIEYIREKIKNSPIDIGLSP